MKNTAELVRCFFHEHSLFQFMQWHRAPLLSGDAQVDHLADQGALTLSHVT